MPEQRMGKKLFLQECQHFNAKKGACNKMSLLKYFKSVLDQDQCPIVICNLQHEIVYMNPAAIARYENWGGKDLLGKSLLNCHNPQSVKRIHEVIDWFLTCREHNRIYTFRNENKDVYMIALRDENGTLIGYYEKHEYRNVEAEGLYSPLS